MTNLGTARAIAILVPSGLLAGALGSQYLGGLHPCEMCHWQRWGHYAALGLALLSFAFANSAKARLFVWLAAAGILSSGLIGFYHAGVELKIFEGFTQCTTRGATGSNADILADIMATPLIRCDDVQWSFLGISMAGWNAILSTLAALVIAGLLVKREKATG